MQEIWKAVPGYEGKYEVSNLGRVKSLSRRADRGIKGFIEVKEKIKSQSISRSGYPTVCISDACLGKKVATKAIHRLMAYAFIRYPLARSEQVNHIDGNKQNNILTNLELCNNSENQKHAWASGLQPRRRPDILQDSDIKHIRDELDRLSQKISKRKAIAKISKGYGISISSVDKIAYGKRWSSV